MFEDAYAERRVAQVMNDTWGHLRPATGRHEGHLLAAFSGYGGERLLISAEFAGVDDSPWLYEAMYDLINDANLKEGHVYRFDGALVVNQKGLRFEGEWSQVELVAKRG